MRELIATGGVPAEREPEGGRLSPAFRGVRKGVWVILVGVLMTLVIGLLTAADDDFAVLLFLPLLCFVVGFVRVLYGVFLENRAPRGKKDSDQPQVPPVRPPQAISAARNLELPPVRVPPATAFTEKQVKTAEIVQPPSVTENTTRLLDEEADSRRNK
ncbi:MAG TPA: hypothetical protein VFH31_11260 [Pyrinomonadaceae bacterium]|nr:hypothetical protein [Pyrinomonadaceae bacterium]